MLSRIVRRRGQHPTMVTRHGPRDCSVRLELADGGKYCADVTRRSGSGERGDKLDQRCTDRLADLLELDQVEAAFAALVLADE